MEFDPTYSGRPMFLLWLPGFLIEYFLDHEGDPKVESIWTNLFPKAIGSEPPAKEQIFTVSCRKYELPEKLRKWIELRKRGPIQLQHRL